MVRDNNEESILRINYVEINYGTNEQTRIEQRESIHVWYTTGMNFAFSRRSEAKNTVMYISYNIVIDLRA